MNTVHDKWFEFWHTFWDFGHFTTELTWELMTLGIGFLLGKGYLSKFIRRHDAEFHPGEHEHAEAPKKRKPKKEPVILPRGSDAPLWTYIKFDSSSSPPNILWAWSTNRGARKTAHRANNNIPVQGLEAGVVTTLCGRKITPKYALTSSQHPQDGYTDHDCRVCAKRAKEIWTP